MGVDDAADVFALLSDGTRVDVLRAIARARHERDPVDSGPVTLSFSALYDRVDVDSTSKLSYHLGELAGPFLRKSDDGYALTYAGEYLVRFVLSGNYREPEPFGPTDVEGRCPFCGATDLVARLFDRQFFLVTCTECERPAAGLPTTPAQVGDGDDEAYVESVRRTYAAQVQQMQRGVCPTCSGRVTGDVLVLPEETLPGEEYGVSLACESCLRSYSMGLPYAVAQHPASVAFHWERGVDVTTWGIWELHDLAHEEQWDAESRADGDYEVTMRRDGDLLRFVLDDAVTVVRTERVRRADGPSADS